MRASSLSRALAAVVDLAVGVALGVLLAPGPLGHYFSAKAVVLLRIGEPDTWFVGPLAMVIGILGELIFVLPLATLISLLPEALLGAALGKLVLRLRIETPAAGPRSGSLAIRCLVKTVPLSATVVALLTGVWAVQVAAFLAAVLMVGQWAVASVSDSLVAHDRLAGTVVSRLARG